MTKDTPTNHRFEGSRNTLAAKRELWSSILPISILRWKLRNFACPPYAAYRPMAISPTYRLWLNLHLGLLPCNFHRPKWPK